jgi:demethylmenaquinone methyltransferase/2-methoxy-6-polyprenyl-1,4-benzoquinol methylase
MVSIRYEIDNQTPKEKKAFIRRMFTSIVPSYDALNRILSLGIDTLWRRSAVRSLRDVRGKMVLDLCCGTGDLSSILHKKGARVVSLDFCHAMIHRGLAKKNIRDHAVLADASVLPFRSGSFDIITVAFGIRNIPDLDNFISEARRVLKPDGRITILELTRPTWKPAGLFYTLYLAHFLPLIGWMVSGRRTAYRYLSATIATFIDPDMLEERFVKNGFSGVCHFHRTFGIATILKCRKKQAGPGDPQPLMKTMEPLTGPVN